MAKYIFRPREQDGTGELFFDAPPEFNLDNGAEFASAEMAVGRDDFGEPAQALALGVTMVLDAVARAGRPAPDKHDVYDRLKSIDESSLGGLLRQKRYHHQWDLPQSVVEHWASQHGF